MRSIVHLDADAFFASVEQAADPRLRGKAIAVGGEQRGIIASASYEARRYGVATPMPTVRARRLCPWLIVLPGDFEKYERFSRWMFSYVYDFTPDVEIGSIDEGYFDLTGARRNPTDIADTIRRAIRQALKLTVSEGIGPNKLVSQIASKLRKPAAFHQVAPGQECAFLHPLPNRWLPGIGPKTAIRLNTAGLPLIGQIAQTPVDWLALVLGRAAPVIRQFANGIDDRPIIREAPAAKSYGQQETFAQDTTDAEFLEATLRRMTDDLMARVRADGKIIRTLTVKVRYNDMAEDQRSESLREPTDLETDVYGKLRPLLRAAWQRRVSLRLVALKFTNVYDSWHRQLDLPLALEGERPREPLPGRPENDSQGRPSTGSGSNDSPSTHPVSYDARRQLAAVIDQLRETHGRYVVMRGHELALRARNDASSSSSPLSITTGGRRSPDAWSHRSSGTRHSTLGIPLRVRSYYSFLDSTLSPQAIVDWAVQHQLPAIALTDVGNLHGAVEFVLAAKQAGIKPILGTELILGGNRVLALVQNREGYRNLCRLLTQTSGSIGVLEQSSTGKSASPPTTPALHHSSTPPLAGLFLERADDWPAVHYATPADRQKYDVLQSIRTLTLLRQEHPDKNLNSAFHFPIPRLAMNDAPAVGRAGSPSRPSQPNRPPGNDGRLGQPALPVSLSRRAAAIVEQCQFDIELGTLHFPAFVPPDGSTPRAFLRRLVLEGLRQRYHSELDKRQSAVETELAIIAEVGYEEYFLVVWDILRECRKNGISWITRGSAADSLVCYCLGISDVCPIRFGLYFRRFLNKDRMALHKLPDIDIDFPHDRKDDVVDLIFQKYGAAHVAVVGGFSTYQARSAFADVAKVLGVSEFHVRRFTERLPHTAARHLLEAVAESQECRELPVHEEPYRTALQMAAFLDGFPRHPKMHPCGVVIAREPMTDLVPCFTSNKGYPTTHFDMDAVEAIGLVKIDILAQGGLAVMRDVMQQVSDHFPDCHPEPAAGEGPHNRMPPPALITAPDSSRLRDPSLGAQDDNLQTIRSFPTTAGPFTDPAVWDLIAGGGARAVHHIESPAMISLCQMTNVREIDGLIAIVSVIRPGAANEGKKRAFTRRYQGLEPVTYPHPSLEACLRDAYGLVVYEEHILQICEAFAGLPPGRADVLRRALNKENWDAVESIGREFAAAARARGHAEEKIAEVWKLVCSFSGYAFCKAHSTAYGVEAYQSAWLKKYYPAEFMAAVLTNGKGFYRPIVYALECHRLGIPLAPPDVNAPGPGFAVVQAAVRGSPDPAPAPDRRSPVILDARRGSPTPPTSRPASAGLLSPVVETDDRDPAGAGSSRCAGSETPAQPEQKAIRIPATRTNGLREQTRERLVAERARGAFQSITDCATRTGATRDELELLMRVGAFDGFGRTRPEQFWEIQRVPHSADPSVGLTNLPSSIFHLQSPHPPLTPPTRLQQLRDEQELLGFPASGHPLELYPDIAWNTYVPVARMPEHIGETITTCGLIVEDRLHHQVTGEPMKFLTLADWTGMVETELFATTYKSYGLVTVRYPVLEVTARVEPFENGNGWSLRVLQAGKPRTQHLSS